MTARVRRASPRATSTWAMPALILLAAACGAGAPAGDAVAPAPPPSVVADGATPQLVQDGFTFTEGPVAGPDGSLYFSDVRENRVYRALADGTVELVLEDTGGANGLAFDAEGRLVAAQGAAGQIGVFGPEGTVTALAAGPADDPLNPNDLILDGAGGVFFTDPGPRGTPEAPAPRRPRVWHVAADGGLRLITETIARPNGITLTLDGSVLLIADTLGPDVLAMDVVNGVAGDLRPWATLQGLAEDGTSGADGMAIDADGRLYVTSLAGVQVFDEIGNYLETIAFPQQPSNVAFGGPDRMTLYVTARTAVYALRMNTAGPADRAK